MQYVFQIHFAHHPNLEVTPETLIHQDSWSRTCLRFEILRLLILSHLMSIDFLEYLPGICELQHRATTLIYPQVPCTRLPRLPLSQKKKIDSFSSHVTRPKSLVESPPLQKGLLLPHWAQGAKQPGLRGPPPFTEMIWGNPAYCPCSLRRTLCSRGQQDCGVVFRLTRNISEAECSTNRGLLIC